MIKRFETLPSVLKWFTVILLLSIIFGFWLLYGLSQRDDFDRDFSLFVICSMIGHGFVGFALLSLKRWGLIVFKCYLYLLFFAIPVGTYISCKTFQYIKQNQIDDIYQ